MSFQTPPIPLSSLGREVGSLDPTQSSRLLSLPESRLVLASYHPRAGAASDTSNLESEILEYSSSRIVVELQPDGGAIWRPIPLAQNSTRIEDEGVWPRLISYCGSLVTFSLEQWEFYKLDPAYNCAINPESIPTITANLGFATGPEVDRSNQNMDGDGDIQPIFDESLLPQRKRLQNTPKKRPGTGRLSHAFGRNNVYWPYPKRANAKECMSYSTYNPQTNTTSFADDPEYEIMRTVEWTSQRSLAEPESEAQPNWVTERLRSREIMRESWSRAPWNNTLAIERVEKLLSSQATLGDSMDDLKIPWPVLGRPLSYLIQDITPIWIQAFFDAVRQDPRYWGTEAVTELIKKCILCFHDDKLINRLRAVDLEVDRELVREATKVVFLELQNQLAFQRSLDS
ncbi:hypothetical protein QCA50_007101 [Cerrena zonata]|uniref:Uncharacterized protein n=1 Tax=Cerrena zonata TaxID=2478898 RepID=A0AAW0G783_9APHY